MPPAKKSAPRRPQDRKPKAVTRKTSAPFEFEHDGVTYELPSPNDAAGQVSGRIVRDAIMDPSGDGQIRLAFATLEAASPDEDALDALYEKPASEMLGIVGDWFEAAQGATPGES